MRCVVSYECRIANDSELSVIPLFQRIKKICRRMHLTVVLNLFITLQGNFLTVGQHKSVLGVLQILLFNQHALEGFRVKPESGATFKALLIGI